MARTRRTYTPEFKAEAVQLVTEQGYSVAEAARSLDLNENLIRSWKRTLEAEGDQTFPGHGKLSPFEEENRRLRAENKRLLAERDIPKKSGGVLRQGGAMTYRFIDAHRRRWPVRLLCQTLEVSPAGYYAWRQRPRSAQGQRQDALLVEIRAIHAQVKARYGSPRLHKELVARGHDCCVNTVARLMREHGIVAKSARQFRVTTTDSDHDLPVAANLLDRQFNPSEANEAWVADITYIPTREGWLYLAAALDLYARRVVGWAMAEHMESRLVVDALELAVQRRLPGENLLAHSDRGSQYASEHYQLLLAKHGITCSMSRRADCWDNAPMASFVASLKKELVHGADFAGRAQARAAIVESIEIFYNNQRRHASLGYVSPAEYEQAKHS
ncbi:MAG: IS3 family transposase [Halobacteriales archaeon]|nr:IS3 family transposase [Halobacteriales archaeon]